MGGKGKASFPGMLWYGDEPARGGGGRDISPEGGTIQKKNEMNVPRGKRPYIRTGRPPDWPSPLYTGSRPNLKPICGPTDLSGLLAGKNLLRLAVTGFWRPKCRCFLYFRATRVRTITFYGSFSHIFRRKKTPVVRKAQAGLWTPVPTLLELQTTQKNSTTYVVGLVCCVNWGRGWYRIICDDAETAWRAHTTGKRDSEASHIAAIATAVSSVGSTRRTQASHRGHKHSSAIFEHYCTQGCTCHVRNTEHLIMYDKPWPQVMTFPGRTVEKCWYPV